jgi:hypothetical protein
VTILGKAWLVSRLQVLLQEKRLHLPQDANTSTLVQELRTYSHSPAPNAADLYGAFKVGTHDDLVNAIGLAVHKSPDRPWTVAEQAEMDAAIERLIGVDEVEALYGPLLDKFGDGDFF